MDKHYKGKIGSVLQLITITPLVILGVALMILGTRFFTNAMHEEVRRELAHVANTAIALYDAAYEGDYRLVEDTSSGQTALRLYKGDLDITQDYHLVDKIKEVTGLEATLFYSDTRIHTTIRDNAGNRLIATGAPEIVIRDVLETGTPHFYTNTTIYNSRYFSYYAPLFNSDGSVAGMLFIGRPVDEVSTSVMHSIYPLLAADAMVILLMAVLILIFARNLAKALKHLQEFCANVAKGNLNTSMSSEITKRSDELGDIGRAALSMQQSLRTMVEQDALTELFNRRSANRHLAQIMQRSAQEGTPFSVCIGDIDHFKRVNDTYGHDCGDLVLKSIADILRKHMHQLGFVARWGGEEFLLVFDRMNVNEAAESLQSLRKVLHKNTIFYEDYRLRITMTFGVTDGPGKELSDLLREADNNLYYGKEHGRDRVIWQTQTEQKPEAQTAEEGQLAKESQGQTATEGQMVAEPKEQAEEQQTAEAAESQMQTATEGQMVAKPKEQAEEQQTAEAETQTVERQAEEPQAQTEDRQTTESAEPPEDRQTTESAEPQEAPEQPEDHQITESAEPQEPQAKEPEDSSKEQQPEQPDTATTGDDTANASSEDEA